jgi:hypothetical protein
VGALEAAEHPRGVGALPGVARDPERQQLDALGEDGVGGAGGVGGGARSASRRASSKRRAWRSASARK